MENPNLDETRPSAAQPGEPVPLDISDTQPTSTKKPSGEPPDPAQTAPVRVGGASGTSQGFDATLPVESLPAPAGPPPVLPAGKPRKRFRLPPAASWSILGVLGLLLIAALSAFGGYNEGIQKRTQAESTQLASEADQQFQLGLQNMDAGEFDLARQRFEYVVQLNPAYPGVTEKLAEVLLYMNATATPTVVPTPTVTPTPDTRNVQERFAQAQQDLANQDWNKAIDTLLALRKADPVYQTVWVDDMLYVSFRNRGKNKILNADLEGGIYDLTVASQFGYLDFDSRSLQDWARLYITGASFWELDWSQAIFYFAQIAPALPNLRDGSGWTAAERYRLALIGYGEDLSQQGDYCAAVEQLQLALSMGADEKGQKLLDEASNQCSGSSEEESNDNSSNDNTPQETEAPPTEPAVTEAPTEPAATEPPPAETPYP